MQKMLKKVKKWFTLVELMVVIIIIWILMAAAGTAFNNYIKKASFTNAQSALAWLATKMETWNQNIIEEDMWYSDWGTEKYYKRWMQLVFRKSSDDEIVVDDDLGKKIKQEGTELSDILKNNYSKVTRYYVNSVSSFDPESTHPLANKGTYVLVDTNGSYIISQIVMYCEAWNSFVNLDDYKNMWQKTDNETNWITLPDWSTANTNLSDLKDKIEKANFNCLVKKIDHEN